MEDELKVGQDYTLDDLGRLVYTEFFLRKRGYCCGLGCRHCPYGYEGDGRSDPATAAYPNEESYPTPRKSGPA